MLPRSQRDGASLWNRLFSSLTAKIELASKMTLIYALGACLLLVPLSGKLPPQPLPAGQSDICNGDSNDSPDCVTPPLATYSPEPKYPENERRARHEGDVILQLVIGTDGATHDISVARSLSPDFDTAAIDAVKTWTFTPAKRNGKPIPLRTHIQVGFHLRR